MKKVSILVVLSALVAIACVGPVKGQTDWNWQSSGYDLRELYPRGHNFVENRPTNEKVTKIASLSGWRLQFDTNVNLPILSVQPPIGLREDYTEGYIGTGYMMPTTLGYVRPGDLPLTFPTIPPSTGDWAHREYVYQYGNQKTFKILFSRLTPAILLTSDAESLRIFDGKKYGIETPSTTWQNVQGTSFAGNPKYFALPTANGVQVKVADAAGAVDISNLNQNWFLMWFGEESYLWGTDKVISPTRAHSTSDRYNPAKQLYPVDVPVLVVMERAPQALTVDPNGGIQINYGSGAQVGQVAVMPLYGAKYPATVETQTWLAQLPADIEAKCRWWYERLGQFPVSVSESYSTNLDANHIQITDSFSFRSLGHGIPFAPISPVVALAAQEGLPIVFDHAVTDSGMPLTIGPVRGIDGVTSYTYTVSGMSKYVLGSRVISDSGAESDLLKSRLNAELDKVVSTGHLAPWWPLFGKRNLFPEFAVWSMPWETLYYLSSVLPVLESPLASSVSNYIQSERQNYPPESYVRTVQSLATVQTMPYEEGARRESHHVDTSRTPDSLNEPYSRMNVRPLMILYTLAEYYATTGDVTELIAGWTTIKDIFRPYIQNSEWSTNTMTPYTSLTTAHGGVLRGGIIETNRMVAGAIGFTRLARLANDGEAETFGHYVLNKALISRFAQEKLVKYLYEAGLQTIPSDPNWHAVSSIAAGEAGVAILGRNHWSSYANDVRRPLLFDQFGVLLADATAYPVNQQLISYADLTPELGRFLHDYALAEAVEWSAAIEENRPAWFRAYADTYLGWENPFSIPQNAYQIFLVKAWILNESPALLTSYLDIPWVQIGDYYYIHKLAEAIKSYRGISWNDDLVVSSELSSATTSSSISLPVTLLSVTTPIEPVNLDTENRDTVDGPVVGTVVTNLADYAGGQVPRHKKLELTFDVDTVASNLQMPYDSAPPSGIEPEIGVTVNALFTPDNWQTIYTQPAFYYQSFLDETKGNQEWFYPTSDFSWKVRFAPDQAGDWQYKIMVQDKTGTTETLPQLFSVTDSDSKGFVRVSQADARYFEFEDGTYFPALGYNMNYNQVSWINPVLDNQGNFQAMSANGIQLVRIWLSQWAIYGSEWNPWTAQDPNLFSQLLPRTGIEFEESLPGHDVSMKLAADYNSCMYIGDHKARTAVKRNTDYRIRILYKTAGIAGPRVANQPFGFVAKSGGWLWGAGTTCHDAGTGTLITPHQPQNTASWQVLEGTLNSGNNDFLPNFFLVLENVNAGSVYVDHVSIEEVLGEDQYGPNIVAKPWMAHHLYMEQRNSYAFDKVLALAEQYGIYLRPVILEKNERIFNRVDYEGNPIPYDAGCFDQDTTNNPEKCWGNQWFYGNARSMTKTRWLQQAWWRYLQARWGYSSNIHSWELLNEGDPSSTQHYTLADEFGKYMHQFTPNDHLVSTSNWHSFPKDQFWVSANYPNVDFADVHLYTPESHKYFTDTAQITFDASMQYGAAQPNGVGKPVIRGETGFVISGSEPATSQFQNDTNAIWLHNFIWGGINSGGLIESYWYGIEHIVSRARDGSYKFDYRYHYRTYSNFIKDIPLNNGHFQDAQAVVTDPNLRVWGQKDPLNSTAHLWIQNKQHTWQNVVDGVAIPALTATVTMSGFQPNTSYTLQWWDTYQPDLPKQIVRTETLMSQEDGSLVIVVSNLIKDIAVKVVLPSQDGEDKAPIPSQSDLYLPEIQTLSPARAPLTG